MSTRHFRAWLACGVALMLAACDAPPVESSTDPGSLALSVPVGADGDTSLREAAPFANDGIGINLGVRAAVGSRERTLVRFDSAAITAAIAKQSLHAAYLELTIGAVSPGWGGGTLSLHRMTRTWAEGNGTFGELRSAGPSWRCANDTDTSTAGNLKNDCTTANGWSMEPPGPPAIPYASTASDTVPLYSVGMTTVRFEVTADVAQLLGGAPNHGWMIKSDGNPRTGAWVQFLSRETTTGPRLVLEVGPDQCPSDASKGAPGQCGCGAPDTDSDGDHVADCLEPTLLPVADTTLRSGLPTGNDGLGSQLGVTSGASPLQQRALVRFDQAAIAAALRGATLRSAKLELEVAAGSSEWRGGNLTLAPMARSWPEGNGFDVVLGAHGPSWLCADDANTANILNDCAVADRWGMDAADTEPLPFGASTASAMLAAGATKLSFDVTGDITRFLNGTPNHGWLIKGVGTGAAATVAFHSRETLRPPRLVLDVSGSGPAGVSQRPSSIPAPAGLPDVGCTQRRNANTNYFTCGTPRTFDAAQQSCARVGMKLLSIDDAAEDAWVATATSQPIWIGARQDSPGTWSWQRTGKVFWRTGAPASSAYNKWRTGEPASGAQNACATRASGAAGRWATEACGQTRAYVCEGNAAGSKLDEFGLFSSLVTQYVMCRVARGEAASDLELATQERLRREAGANLPNVINFLTTKCADFQAFCRNVDTKTMLAELAGFDPCKTTEPISTYQLRAAMNQLISGGRIRENMCATRDRHITVGFEPLTEIGPDNTRGEVISAAAPWIVGVDPVRSDPTAYFGDRALREDWDKRRSNPTNADDTGDGLSPFGVRSLDRNGNTIPCGDDSVVCDASQGQLCGSRVGLGNVCYSFPVVTHGSELRLRGYNFWDAQTAEIGFVRVDNPALRLTAPNVTVVPSGDCRTPTRSRTELFAEGIQPDLATATVTVDGGYFYELRYFNQNGSYFTNFDAAGLAVGADPPRTVHTCWAGCNLGGFLCPQTCEVFGTLNCAITACSPPSPAQTCEIDGRLPAGGCATDWTRPPRELDTRDQFDQRLCQHSQWDPPICAETPWWFSSHPVMNRAIVYVQAQRPQYEFRTRLDVVKCVEESGWSWPGEDEFVANLTSFPLDRRRLEELINQPQTDIPDSFTSTFSGDFDEGERQPGKSTTIPAFRSLNQLLTSTRVGPDGEVVYRLSLAEDDGDLKTVNDTITGTLTAAAGVLVGIDVLAGCSGWCAAAGGVVGAVAFALDRILSPFESADNLGRVGWSTDVTQFNTNIALSHTDAFNRTPPLPLSQVDTNGDKIVDRVWGDGSTVAQVLHPMDYTDRYLDNPDRCSCSTSNTCTNDVEVSCQSTNGACYAGRCIGGDPYLFASPPVFTPSCQNDATCRRGFRQRFDVTRSEESSRYQLDFQFELRRQNASTGLFDVDPI